MDNEERDPKLPLWLMSPHQGVAGEGVACTVFPGGVLSLNNVTAKIRQQPRRSDIIAAAVEVSPMLAGTRLRCSQSQPLGDPNQTHGWSFYTDFSGQPQDGI